MPVHGVGSNSVLTRRIWLLFLNLFERIDSRLKIKTLGTGLGLYLIRKILSELLGGTVEATSKPEEGSIFTITIPIKMPEMVEQNNTTILDIFDDH